MGTVTVDLKAAGLTHAAGKSDKCGGAHELGEEFLADRVPGMGWVRAAGLEDALQRLHELAHPGGAAYLENCTEQVCADACNLLCEGDE